jgi:hypothetical protein
MTHRSTPLEPTRSVRHERSLGATKPFRRSLRPPGVVASERLVPAWARHALVVAALTACPIAAGAGEAAWKPELLPPEREMAAALTAGPPAVAEGAGIYLLGESGFRLARPSHNGFHCLVERSWPGAFEPQCFDAEGSETLLQARLLAAELRMKGEPRQAIERALGDAYASGRLRPPRRAGINYMLSPENRVPVDDEGTIRPYRPHVMIYAPFLTNADFGVDPAGRSPGFVIHEGTPGAYLIVPVPGEEARPHPAASPPAPPPGTESP